MVNKLIAAILALIPLFAYSQQPEVELTSEYNSAREFVITAKVNGYGKYSVYVNFTKLTNYNSPGEVVRTVSGIHQEVIRLKPKDANMTCSASYTYRSVRGIVGRTLPDSTLVYRLPFSVHKQDVKARRPVMQPSNSKTADPNPHMLVFILEKGDTIFAARKGIVMSVKGNRQIPNSTTTANVKHNIILVQHEDGTYASYSSFQTGSAMVGEGTTVYPDTPIALAGTMDGQRYSLFFAAHYHIFTRDPSAPFADRSYDPVFLTTEGSACLQEGEWYGAAITPDLITREMNSREKKQYASDNGAPAVDKKKK